MNSPWLRSIKPPRSSLLISRVTASRCVLIRFAKLEWVGRMQFACALPTGKSEDFSANPLLNIQRTELADSLTQTAVSHAQTACHRESDFWLFLHYLDKNGVWQAQNGCCIQRDYTGLVALSCQCRLFTKVITGTVLREGNFPALGRIDHRSHQPGDDEQNVRRMLGLTNDKLPFVRKVEFPPGVRRQPEYPALRATNF